MKGFGIGLALVAMIALASSRRAVSIRLTEGQIANLRSGLRTEWDRIAVNGTVDRKQLEELWRKQVGDAEAAAAAVARIDADANGRITWAEMSAAIDRLAE